MRKFHIAYLLVFAPVLMGADTDEFASVLNPLIANSLPICTDNQFLTYASGGLACREVVGAMLNVPDCNKTGQLLTYTKGSEIGVYTCVDKGTESLDAADVTLINQTYTRLQSFKTTINNLMPGSKASVAKYCGQYTAAQNVNGAITGNNGVTGVAGAANLCATVPACGTGARMCTVYDMYNSVAFGAVPATLGQSWVHMQSWSHNSAAQAPAANGLADNCSGWTYPTGDKFWYGTTVEWKNAPTGQKALHFASGPGVVSCAARFPIACCK
jgi:hypothetical protein